MTRSGRWLGLAFVVCVAGVAFAGVVYRQYAAEHLRDTPKVPVCVVIGRLLRKPEVVSGTEPHDDVNGQTVYLAKNEDKAVRCAVSIDKDLARRLTTALAETEPEVRGLKLLKTFKEVPPGKEHDRVAHAAYRLVDGAMQALPPLPETKAAAEELDLLHACRFATRTHCPTRPGVPLAVWLVGLPSALGLLMALSVPARALIARLVERIRVRRAVAAAAKQASATRAHANGTPSPPKKSKKKKKAKPASPSEPTPDTDTDHEA